MKRLAVVYGMFSSIGIGSILIFAQTTVADTTLETELKRFQELLADINTIVNILIIIAVAAAFLVFFWGLARFLALVGENQGPETIKSGKQKMIWGVIAIFVLTTLWGIIYFLELFFLGGNQGRANIEIFRLPIGSRSALIPSIEQVPPVDIEFPNRIVDPEGTPEQREGASKVLMDGASKVPIDGAGKVLDGEGASKVPIDGAGKVLDGEGASKVPIDGAGKVLDGEGASKVPIDGAGKVLDGEGASKVPIDGAGRTITQVPAGVEPENPDATTGPGDNAATAPGNPAFPVPPGAVVVPLPPPVDTSRNPATPSESQVLRDTQGETPPPPAKVLVDRKNQIFVDQNTQIKVDILNKTITDLSDPEASVRTFQVLINDEDDNVIRDPDNPDRILIDFNREQENRALRESN